MLTYCPRVVGLENLKLLRNSYETFRLKIITLVVYKFFFYFDRYSSAFENL